MHSGLQKLIDVQISDFREMIATLGSIWCVPVLQASDCAEGLKVLNSERNRIKTILLDYFMPGMEPVKCAASILGAAGSGIQVVLVTAAADAGLRASELKINRWLSKPFEMTSLQAVIASDGDVGSG